ncbi:hypothetical protein POG22_23820 [Geitlerinema sp. CS-897]|nr:hypothetical protein [Geitlerinema sp. CS-897]
MSRHIWVSDGRRSAFVSSERSLTLTAPTESFTDGDRPSSRASVPLH